MKGNTIDAATVLDETQPPQSQGRSPLPVWEPAFAEINKTPPPNVLANILPDAFSQFQWLIVGYELPRPIKQVHR